MLTKEILKVYPISYRQLDTWTTFGYLGDRVKETGSGKSREYTSDEVDLLERIIAFVQAGVRPPIAAAIARGDVEATLRLVEAMEMVK